MDKKKQYFNLFYCIKQSDLQRRTQLSTSSYNASAQLFQERTPPTKSQVMCSGLLVMVDDCRPVG